MLDGRDPVAGIRDYHPFCFDERQLEDAAVGRIPLDMAQKEPLIIGGRQLVVPRSSQCSEMNTRSEVLFVGGRLGVGGSSVA